MTARKVANPAPDPDAALKRLWGQLLTAAGAASHATSYHDGLPHDAANADAAEAAGAKARAKKWRLESKIGEQQAHTLDGVSIKMAVDLCWRDGGFDGGLSTALSGYRDLCRIVGHDYAKELERAEAEASKRGYAASGCTESAGGVS